MVYQKKDYIYNAVAHDVSTVTDILPPQDLRAHPFIYSELKEHTGFHNDSGF